MISHWHAGFVAEHGMAVALLQTETPTPGVGVDELVEYWPVFVRVGWFLAGSLAVLVLGWFLLTPIVTRIVRRRNRNNPTIDEAVGRYLRLLVVVTAVVVGVGTAGYGHVIGDSAIVVAAATLAVGVAGQTVIGSIVSGIVLVGDPEFNVGDFIEWEGGEGTVQSITLRVTRVLTPGGELVTVPNTVLTGSAVTRPFGERRHRIVDTVRLSYESDLDRALELLVETAEELDEIEAAPSPRAYVEGFGSDAVTVGVHYWVDRPRRTDVLAVQSVYARAVKRRLEHADVEMSPASAVAVDGRITVDGVGVGDEGDGG